MFECHLAAGVSKIKVLINVYTFQSISSMDSIISQYVISEAELRPNLTAHF